MVMIFVLVEKVVVVEMLRCRGVAFVVVSGGDGGGGERVDADAGDRVIIDVGAGSPVLDGTCLGKLGGAQLRLT